VNEPTATISPLLTSIQSNPARQQRGTYEDELSRGAGNATTKPGEEGGSATGEESRLTGEDCGIEWRVFFSPSLFSVCREI
jgi:hypothetical protein